MLLATLLTVAAHAEELLPRILPVPPEAHTVVTSVPTAGRTPPTLTQVSATKNTVTDEAAWFAANGLRLPVLEVPPAFVPPTVGGHPLVRLIDQGGTLTALYGDGYDASVVVVYAPDGHVRGAWDVGAWLTPAQAVRGDELYVHAGVRWAWVVEDVLYLATSHRTYASSSYGKNAYITAIDVATGDLRWRSDPLVCNAQSFVVIRDAIVCGYGFTAEPDSMVLLDRADGHLLGRTKLKTGPDYFVLADDKLYVRTYNMDYVYSVK